jgi:hypothetical protein
MEHAQVSVRDVVSILLNRHTGKEAGTGMASEKGLAISLPIAPVHFR